MRTKNGKYRGIVYSNEINYNPQTEVFPLQDFPDYIPCPKGNATQNFEEVLTAEIVFYTIQ
jgi:hypothetical protein